jgi:hypothetical protein
VGRKNDSEFGTGGLNSGFEGFRWYVAFDTIFESSCRHSNGHLGQATRENQVSLEWSRQPWLGYCLMGSQKQRF